MLAGKPKRYLAKIVLACAMAIGLSLSSIALLQAEEPAASEPVEKLTSQQLLANLGANEFSVRESAEAEILARGKEILPLLREARTSPDPEVRLRATTLYQQLSQRLRKESFVRFMAMDQDVDLPGWKRFKEVHGDSREIRKLYASMLEQEWEMLVTLETQPQMIDYMFFQRANKLREELYGPNHVPITEGSAAAMLHCASQADVRITNPSMEQIKFLLAAPQVTTSLQDPEKSEPLLSVFDHWLKANLEMDRFTPEMRFVVLTTCLREGIKSGKIVAKQMLDVRASPVYQNGMGQFGSINATQQMMYAMLAVSKLGDEEDIDFLEKYFEDKTEVSIPSVQGDHFKTELRDVALVSVLHLSGQEPKDYGFPRISTDPNFLYNIRSIGFTTEEQRSEAFEKWDKTQKAMAETK